MELKLVEDGFEIVYKGIKLISHSQSLPFAYLGRGEEEINMNLGNFHIKDSVFERIPLPNFNIKEISNGCEVEFFYNKDEKGLSINVFEEKGRLRLITSAPDYYNRCWIRILADQDEFIYGGGEQFSHFNLRGKNFPIITTEQGVGRNKKTLTTFQADNDNGGGGDYWTTFFPQSTFVSSKKYFCHIDNAEYQELDFSNNDYHELHMWGTNYDITFECGETYLELIEKLTGLLGRQPLLPEWFYEGAILGIQGGTDTCIDKINRLQEAGAVIKGIWCQDWAGVRHTSFGKRLFWDWIWNRELYPELDEQIKKWGKEGINFLGYFNPYLCNDGTQFVEAKEKGLLALNQDGEVYEVDFGEYLCGIVDFTNPEAYTWFRDMMIKNAIDLGIKGWMADFGEYLPIDTVLHSGEDPMIMHNKWPALWAKVNYDALVESDTLGEIVYFMRAGSTGSQKHCTMIWAGDQNVDFSLDDGLASVITGALSLGMSGYGLHHSDTGGYTTLYDMKRTKELFMKWTDFNTFTLVLRTHEGNRPDDNWQFDSDDQTISHFAWASRTHQKLKDYLSHLVKENTERGIPVMRPLFMHYEDDLKTFELKYQYMLGEDMIVAPVYEEGSSKVEIYLPDDQWIYLWDSKEWSGGTYEIEAPIGAPAVFYRKESEFKNIFQQITKEGAWQDDKSNK